MSKLDINKIMTAVEQDVGHEIEGLREALAEVAEDVPNGNTTTPEQILVRSARKASGMSQSAFAQSINTPIRTLQEWEQGRSNPPGVAIKLCQLLLSHPDLAA